MTRSKTLWRIAFIPVLLSFIGFATFSGAHPVHASTITVQSTADTGGSCPGVTCTLRTALITAVTGDTINFSLSYPATITVATALTFTGKNNITIDGPGADKLTISGGNTSRVFLINSAISVTINRVKIADGRTSGTYTSTNAGAGFRYDTTTGSGTATFNEVWFDNNNAAYDGGAVYNPAISTLKFYRTTFTNNGSINGTSGTWGGAILNASGTSVPAMVIANSTFYNNTAYSQGAAIRSSGGNVIIHNTTIYGNKLQSGSGTGAGLRLSFGGSSFDIRNTIIALNQINGVTTGALANCDFSPTSGFAGTNNIEFGPTTSACNKTGMPFSLVDPQLGGLTTYGGNNQQVLVPNTGSPAIEGGDAATCANANVANIDEVGSTRPLGAACDIGAVEVIPAATATPTATATFTATATDTATDTPTATETATLPPDPTATNTPSETPTATETATNTATLTPSNTLTNTPSQTNTATLTPSRTNTPTLTPSNTATNTPTASNTPVPPRPDTIGVYNSGVFYLRNTNNSGAADITAFFGGDPSDLPVAGDWNGDGVDTIGVYRNSTGFFFLSDSNTSPAVNYSPLFGNPGDTPFAGKWTADMTHDGIGVYRNSNGILYQRKALTGGFDDFFAVYGNPGDKGFAGDWDGNGFDSIGIYRSSNQTWFLTNNSTPSGITFSDIDFVWDISTNLPVVGDWNADGSSTVGYFTTLGVFDLHSTNASAGSDNAFAFGPGTGKPIAGKWVAASRPPLSGVVNSGAQTGGSSNPSDTDRAD